jgi:hypothetical protein
MLTVHLKWHVNRHHCSATDHGCVRRRKNCHYENVT